MGNAGLAAGVLNDNVFPLPKAGADVVVATADAPNVSVELVVAGVPKDNELVAVGAAPIQFRIIVE